MPWRVPAAAALKQYLKPDTSIGAVGKLVLAIGLFLKSEEASAKLSKKEVKKVKDDAKLLRLLDAQRKEAARRRRGDSAA